MKNLQNLKGAKALDRNEQKAITGGGLTAYPNGCSNNTCSSCAPNEECVEVFCGPNGPFGQQSSEFQCISVVNHK